MEKAHNLRRESTSLWANARAGRWAQLRAQLRTLWGKVGRYELAILVPLALIVGGVWLFV